MYCAVGTVCTVKLTGKRVRKLNSHWPQFFQYLKELLGGPAVFGDTVDPSTLDKAAKHRREGLLGYDGLFTKANHIFDQLNDMEIDWTHADADKLQVEIDAMCFYYRHLPTHTTITNYFLDFQTGMITHFLKRYGNLARISNQRVEFCVGMVRQFSLKRTQRFGYGGRNGHRSAYPIAKACMRYFGRRLCYTISGGSKAKVKAVIDSGMKKRKRNC